VFSLAPNDADIKEWEMREFSATRAIRSPLVRQIVAWLGVGVLVFGATHGGNALRPLVRGLQVSAEVRRVSVEYERQIKENQALEAEIAFLHTDAGRRWAAWRYLGMAEPGWHVGRTVESAPQPERAMSRPQRLQAWLTAQQERSARQVREAGQVLRIYAGHRPLAVQAVSRNPGPPQLSNTGAAGEPLKSESTGPAAGEAY
jgi:hypothetical protein